MKFTLYTANCTENAKNAVYPNKAEIDNEEDFKAAICRDHVSAEYKNSHRSLLDYICGDADVMDCDNDKTENSKEWVRPEMSPNLRRPPSTERPASGTRHRRLACPAV